MTMKALTAFAAFACIFAGGACGPRIEGLDTGPMPEEVRADYQVFAARCSKCHSLARPLSAHITDDEQWIRYVNRMRRQQGSGISMDDQARILRFLRYYAADLRRRDAERSGAPAASPPPPPPPPPPPVPPLAAPVPAPVDGAKDGGL